MPGFDARQTGADQMLKLGKDLRAAGRKDLRKEFLRAGRELGKPVAEAYRLAALTALPKGGGLNVWVAARMKTTTSTRLAGSNVGVKFKTKRPGVKGLSDLAALDGRGKARHPLFGDREHWYTTEVEAGWIEAALAAMGDTVRAEFLQAVDRVTAQLRAEGP